MTRKGEPFERGKVDWMHARMRNIEKNEKQLEALQATRKAAEEKVLEEAKLLAQLALMKGESWDPQKDGFVFSATDLNRLTNEVDQYLLPFLRREISDVFHRVVRFGCNHGPSLPSESS